MERCVTCKASALRNGSTDHRLTLDGVAFLSELPALICDSCGEAYTALDAVGRFELAAAAWLTGKGHCTPGIFKFVRKTLGLRAADLGELVGVASETVSRWENGHAAIPVSNFALLGDLVADRLEGRNATMKRLQALKAPAKTPRRAVRLKLPKVG